MEGGLKRLAEIRLENGLYDIEDTVADLFVFDEVALEELDANINIFFEKLSVDFLALPQHSEIQFESIFDEHDAPLLVL